MNIRKIIREEIARVFKEAETTGSMAGSASSDDTGSMLNGTLTDISGVLQADYDNMDVIIRKLDVDSKNRKNDIKSKLQIKSKLPADNPDRKGLNVSIPAYQSDDKVRDEQLKNLKDTQKGIAAAQDKLNKQQLDMEKQTKQSGKTPSVLPSLESPI